MKHPRRALAALLCALIVACGVVVPSVARAAEGDVSQSSTMYVITSCDECAGLPHDEYWTGVDYTVESFTKAEGVTISSVKSSDESLVTAQFDPEEGMVDVRPAGGKTGTAYVTVTLSDGSTYRCKETVLDVYDNWDGYVAWCGEEGVDLDWVHYATLVVDDLLPFTENTIRTSWGKTYVGYSYTSSDTSRDLKIETSFSVSDPSVLTIDEEGLITPLKAGTTDVTMTITDLAHPKVTFTDTATYTVIDDGETPAEPWAEDGSLLPYTIKDGVMTFDGRPDLGEWYQLDLDLGEGVTTEGVITGGTLLTMTVTTDMLDPSDPLYSKTGYADGPFFVRGDNHGSYTSLLFNYPEGKALSYRLEGSGSITPTGGNGSLLVQLSGPSTLKLSVANETVVTNEQGASISHTPNDGEWGSDGIWSSLTLVTDQLGGDVAQAATDSVVAVIDGVTGHPYVFDIHLEDMVGNVFAIPDGDKVTVTLPIPEGLSAEGLHVFHVADDGTVTDMNATVDVETGTVSFTTTHFSTFVLANVAADDSGKGAGEKTDGLAKTGDASALPALLAAASGGAALLGGRALRRRR